MRQKRELCCPHEAAQRLGISVDEVLDLVATGELAAVTYLDDDRWFVELDSLERMARKARRQVARPAEGLRRRTDLMQILRRGLNAMF